MKVKREDDSILRVCILVSHMGPLLLWILVDNDALYVRWEIVSDRIIVPSWIAVYSTTFILRHIILTL